MLRLRHEDFRLRAEMLAKAYHYITLGMGFCVCALRSMDRCADDFNQALATRF